MRHDIDKKNFFNIFKKNWIIKDIVSTNAEAKNCKQRLINSPPTISGVQTPSNQNFSLTQLWNQVSFENKALRRCLFL